MPHHLTSRLGDCLTVVEGGKLYDKSIACIQLELKTGIAFGQHHTVRATSRPPG